jgi:hypothetical protein
MFMGAGGQAWCYKRARDGIVTWAAPEGRKPGLLSSGSHSQSL